MNFIIIIKVKLSCKMVAYSKVTLTYNVTYTFHYFCMCIYIHLLYIFVTVIQCIVHDIAGWLTYSNCHYCWLDILLNVALMDMLFVSVTVSYVCVEYLEECINAERNNRIFGLFVSNGDIQMFSSQ